MRDRVVSFLRVKASTLKDHPSNWRTHPPAQRAALRGLLEEVGFADALLARREGDELILVDGHLRKSIDKNATVPVLLLDVSAEEAELLLASMDPITSLAGARKDKLEELLARVGSSSGALGELLAGLAQSVRGDKVLLAAPDSLPETVERRCTPGDVWALGRHRLLCGDATRSKDVQRLLGGETPSLMVTDQPFGVNYDPTWREREARKGNLAYAARRTGPVTGDERADWSEAFECFPGQAIYCWHAAQHTATVKTAIEGSGFVVRSQIIWAKPHYPISRGHYHWRHECCWYAVRKGARSGWIGDRKQTTLWTDVSLDENVPGGHSTQKPVELMARAIRNHAGDVYDPFVGSGTTLIAAEQLHRRCFAAEISPSYCDIVLARFEQATGERAVLEERP